MKGSQVTINGRIYDGVTGLPIAHPVTAAQTQTKATPPSASKRPTALARRPLRAFSDIGPARKINANLAAKPTPKPAPQAARTASQTPHSSVHKTLQKSQTLNRAALKRPVSSPVAQPKKSAITHFAPHAQPLNTRAAAPLLTHSKSTLKPQASAPHHQSAATEKHTARPAPHTHRKVNNESPKHLPSQALKEQLIKERIHEAETAKATQKKAGFFKRLRQRQPKLATILTTSLSMLVLATYMTYINLPNISMKVAATKAGINATLPGYHPDGYSLNGAITYAPGQVAVNYKLNSGNQSFTVTQKTTTWDSQAVLENYVTKQTTAYLTFQEKGLTLYTFDNKAAWTNAGLLYTIDGDAPLSSEQIIKLASSM